VGGGGPRRGAPAGGGGGGPRLEESAVALSADWKPLVRDQFYLKRVWTDLPGYLAFHSSALSYLGYFSPVAGVLHKLLYLFRKPFYDYEHPDRTPS